jgi:hypothetical protein
VAAITKNRNFFKWPKLLYFKPECHLGWRAGLSDTILKGTHPGTIPARFGLIWFSGFRGGISIMMSFLAYITGFFMNFELLPILTDYAN